MMKKRIGMLIVLLLVIVAEVGAYWKESYEVATGVLVFFAIACFVIAWMWVPSDEKKVPHKRKWPYVLVVAISLAPIPIIILTLILDSIILPVLSIAIAIIWYLIVIAVVIKKRGCSKEEQPLKAKRLIDPNEYPK